MNIGNVPKILGNVPKIRAIGVSSQAILKAADAGPDVLQELEIDVEKLIR